MFLSVADFSSLKLTWRGPHQPNCPKERFQPNQTWW